MHRRLSKTQQLPGSSFWFFAACVVMMVLTVPVVLKAHEPQSTPNLVEANASANAADANASTKAADTNSNSNATDANKSAKPPEEESIPSEPPKPSNALKFSWDNTLKYSNAFRVSGRNANLIDPAKNPTNIDQDDGDRNFHGGLVSNRVDLLSEMDVIYGNFGVRGSMAAWSDTTYNQRTGNTSPQTYNALSSDYKHFPSDTKDLQFTNAELLDAFVFGKFNLGERTLSFRGGQFAQQWGEVLFFGNNGIAGGMAPIDALKLLSVPNSQFKEIIRPVPQVSAQLQISPKLSIGAYYQVMWQATRLPPVGSYYSTLDFLGDGNERILQGQPLIPVPGAGPAAFFHSRDHEAHDNGQFGVQLKTQVGHGFGLGLYAIQFHDKVPQLYIYPSVAMTPAGPLVLNPATFNPFTGEIGTYSWQYHQNIRAFGLSATKTTGNINWAAEISGRTNMDLVSDAQVVLPNIVADNNDHPLYATGTSFHANVSAFATVPPNFISREANFLGEIAWNRLLGITHNAAALDPNTTRDAVGFRLIYEPFYRQMRPGFDVSFPFGFAFFPMGRSAVVQSFGPNRGGDFNIGVSVAYHDAWRFGVAYNGFYGNAAGVLDAKQQFTFGQPLADRNYISFSVRRTVGIKAARKANQ